MIVESLSGTNCLKEVEVDLIDMFEGKSDTQLLDIIITFLHNHPQKMGGNILEIFAFNYAQNCLNERHPKRYQRYKNIHKEVEFNNLSDYFWFMTHDSKETKVE